MLNFRGNTRAIFPHATALSIEVIDISVFKVNYYFKRIIGVN